MVLRLNASDGTLMQQIAFNFTSPGAWYGTTGIKVLSDDTTVLLFTADALCSVAFKWNALIDSRITQQCSTTSSWRNSLFDWVWLSIQQRWVVMSNYNNYLSSVGLLLGGVWLRASGLYTIMFHRVACMQNGTVCYGAGPVSVQTGAGSMRPAFFVASVAPGGSPTFLGHSVLGLDSTVCNSGLVTITALEAVMTSAVPAVFVSGTCGASSFTAQLDDRVTVVISFRVWSLSFKLSACVLSTARDALVCAGNGGIAVLQTDGGLPSPLGCQPPYTTNASLLSFTGLSVMALGTAQSGGSVSGIHIGDPLTTVQTTATATAGITLVGLLSHCNNLLTKTPSITWSEEFSKSKSVSQSTSATTVTHIPLLTESTTLIATVSPPTTPSESATNSLDPWNYGVQVDRFGDIVDPTFLLSDRGATLLVEARDNLCVLASVDAEGVVVSRTNATTKTRIIALDAGFGLVALVTEAGELWIFSVVLGRFVATVPFAAPILSVAVCNSTFIVIGHFRGVALCFTDGTVNGAWRFSVQIAPAATDPVTFLALGSEGTDLLLVCRSNVLMVISLDQLTSLVAVAPVVVGAVNPSTVLSLQVVSSSVASGSSAPSSSWLLSLSNGSLAVIVKAGLPSRFASKNESVSVLYLPTAVGATADYSCGVLAWAGRDGSSVSHIDNTKISPLMSLSTPTSLPTYGRPVRLVLLHSGSVVAVQDALGIHAVAIGTDVGRLNVPLVQVQSSSLSPGTVYFALLDSSRQWEAVGRSGALQMSSNGISTVIFPLNREPSAMRVDAIGLTLLVADKASLWFVSLSNPSKPVITAQWSFSASAVLCSAPGVAVSSLLLVGKFIVISSLFGSLVIDSRSTSIVAEWPQLSAVSLCGPMTNTLVNGNYGVYFASSGSRVFSFTLNYDTWTYTTISSVSMQSPCRAVVYASLLGLVFAGADDSVVVINVTATGSLFLTSSIALPTGSVVWHMTLSISQSALYVCARAGGINIISTSALSIDAAIRNLVDVRHIGLDKNESSFIAANGDFGYVRGALLSNP